MVAFNNEIASAEKIGMHLSEIGRLQNNAGAIMQFMAVIFVICVYFFNALVYPDTPHRTLYGCVLAVDALFIFSACFSYLRCLTLSVGWSAQHRHPKTRFHFLSNLSEEQIERMLLKTVRSFRCGNYFFFLCFFNTFLLIILVAFGEVGMLPL